MNRQGYPSEVRPDPQIAVAADSDGASLAIIIPIYNEEETIHELLDQIVKIRGRNPWEIIAVNDGSTDGTSRIVESFKGRVRIMRHTSNRGYGASLKTGILSTRAENVLFIDSDGQHDPSDIPAFVDALQRYECVLSVRPKGAGIPGLRKPGKWVLQRVCNFLANIKIPDINSGFRAGRRILFMRMLDLLPEGFSFSVTSLMYVLKSRFSHTFIPIRCHARQGKSSVRILRDGIKTMLLALRLIMLFDPLRAFGYPAIGLMAVGLVYQIYILVTTGLHIVGGSIISILGGIILFHFGLLADQIASLRKEISSHYSLYWEEYGVREKADHEDR